MKTDMIKAAFLGAAIGDALGVPVEFKSRAVRQDDPVIDFRGFGTWKQPPGTFSDDSSLLFCTAESLCLGFDLDDMAGRFIRWESEGYWAAHQAAFDIGNATSTAIERLKTGVSPTVSGGMREQDNGNGSLMRILPLAFWLQAETSVDVRYQIVKQVSGITHGHFRSVMACFCYVELAINLLNSNSPAQAYRRMQTTVNTFAIEQNFAPAEMILFNRLLGQDIAVVPSQNLQASGYVLHTLEAAIWCLLTTDSYETCVLQAINLGEDTDTTGCVAGGLAGLQYDFEAIPSRWIQGLVRSADVFNLAERFAAALTQATAKPE
jgi:ADP-ribosyl-[dinitrogen reductase] hydrolase